MSGWDKKRDVVQRYDVTSSIYDMRYAEEQAAKIEAALKNMRLVEHSSVLDVGCGTGILFSYVADKSKEIVGLDISKKTLVRAKERAKSFANVRLVLADADNMPLKTGVFSSVFAITLIQNAPRPQETLIEIKRVARPDSTVVVTGLKNCFSQESFETLLEGSGLRISTLEKGSELKCYVAVCTILDH